MQQPAKPKQQQLIPGLWYWKNPKNQFAVLKLHYSADPEKAKPEWIEEAKRGTTTEDWECEYEINFEQTRGKRVIPQYAETSHRKDIAYNPYLTVYRGWDFGYHRPACVITQMNNDDQWCFLQEFLGRDVQFEDFVQHILDNSPQFFEINGEKVRLQFKDFCDPAGTQKSDKSIRTSIEILNAFGIYPKYTKSSPAERARILRSQFSIRTDGKPSALVDNGCQLIHEGLLGGYHYPEEVGFDEDEDPEKDGFYDHLFDATGYIAYHIFKYISTNKDRKPVRRPNYVQRVFNRFTGS